MKPRAPTDKTPAPKGSRGCGRGSVSVESDVPGRLLRTPSQETLLQLIERIGARLEQIREPLPDPLDVQPLPPKPPTRPVFAVDGSSYVVQDGRSFVIGGFRAAGIGFRVAADPLAPERSQVQRIAALETDTFLELLDQPSLTQVWQRHYREVTGRDAESLPFPETHRVLFEDVLAQLRILREWGVYGSLIHTAPEGAILLLDGTLMSGEGVISEDIRTRLLETARRRGMVLVGIVKDSTRRLGEVPLHLQVIANVRRMGVTGPWYVHLPRENAWFVQFTERTEWVFRCEMVLPSGAQPAEILSEIATFAHIPPVMGYPLPLVKVDQEIAFTREEAERLVRLIRRYALSAGLSLTEFDRLFRIQHSLIDRMRLRTF